MSDLAPHFKHAEILRVVEGDTVLCDPQYGGHCGYLTFKEAEILRKIGIAFPDNWLEIGSHTGWSSSHLAVSGNKVTALDPMFTIDPTFLERATDNWKACGVFSNITPLGVPSDEFFATSNQKWNGVFVDGCHDAPAPVWDVLHAVNRLAPGGVIVLHDHVGDPVKDAATVLRLAGFNIHVFPTLQELTLCWLGDPTLPPPL